MKAGIKEESMERAIGAVSEGKKGTSAPMEVDTD
jgi:hypothetical protein